ncbi:MFS transporter [Lichenihabitans psoromatis]|uniref:MFS transporter n=1 Tax=Lichenihabitans psoromatis TaxID=2528642 RepID=UPI001036928E|nr:MFS transporter [Lichenihabitans psoromatis]
MLLRLLISKRFAPLFWCQFFSAFNDNLVRTMLAMMILFRVGEEAAGPLVTLAVGVFIAPSLLLSAVGGQLADASDKAKVARWLKLGEFAIQILVAAGFWFGSIGTLFVGLFALGAAAALFSPIKYGILPDHLSTEELTAGNAFIEGATFVAILLGLVAGGITGLKSTAPWLVVAQLIGVGLASYLATLFIPSTRIAAPGLKITRNLVASTFTMIRDLRTSRRLWIGALGVSWFWLSGAVTLSLVPLVVKQRIGGGVEVETAISVFFAIGVGLGSLATVLIARGRIYIKHVPFAAVFMAIFLVDIGLATSSLGNVHETMSLGDFLHSFIGLRIAIDLIGLACAGGMFSVPLFAAVQSWSSEDRRARVVAGVSVLNALFMVLGSVVTASLQSAYINVPDPVLLIGLGAANVGAALYFYVTLPRGHAVTYAPDTYATDLGAGGERSRA